MENSEDGDAASGRTHPPQKKRGIELSNRQLAQLLLLAQGAPRGFGAQRVCIVQLSSIPKVLVDEEFLRVMLGMRFEFKGS